MSCAKPREVLHAHLDGELDVVRSLEIEEHLRGCATCAESYDALRSLRSAFAEEALAFKAPAGLGDRIRDAVRREAPERRRTSSVARRWVPLAAAAMLALAVLPFVGRSGAPDHLIDDIVSNHVRSLMVAHLTDVPSSDKHTVKPWFDGKVDFSPPVVDLADHGFPLAGGRLDYLEERAVVALVYGRHKHLINLFVWPSGANEAERTLERRGFALVHWASGGMTFWAVSDLNATELGEFAELVRERATTPTAKPG